MHQPKPFLSALIIPILALLGACGQAEPVRNDPIADPHLERFVGHWTVDGLEFINDNRAFLERHFMAKAKKEGMTLTSSQIATAMTGVFSNSPFAGTYLDLNRDGSGTIATDELPGPLLITWRHAKGVIHIDFTSTTTKDPGKTEMQVVLGHLKFGMKRGEDTWVLSFVKAAR